jgi:hypothetical protein
VTVAVDVVPLCIPVKPVVESVIVPVLDELGFVILLTVMVWVPALAAADVVNVKNV